MRSNFADRWPVAADCITLHGSQFRVLLPDAQQKHLGTLGVRVSMLTVLSQER